MVGKGPSTLHIFRNSQPLLPTTLHSLPCVATYVYGICRCIFMYFISISIFYVQKIETMEHRMYTHTLDKSPDLEKLFNLYAKKSEVSILCMIDYLHINIAHCCCYRLMLK